MSKIDIKVVLVIFVTLILVVGSFFLSFYIVNKDRKSKGQTPFTIKQFLNKNQKLDVRKVLVGMSFGIVFGFIDNAGLWFGLHSFQKYIPGGLLTKSGWGNTYSDGLGASLGTSVAVILRTLYPVNDSPIWVDTAGIIVGCILGIYIPRLITGRR